MKKWLSAFILLLFSLLSLSSQNKQVNRPIDSELQRIFRQSFASENLEQTYSLYTEAQKENGLVASIKKIEQENQAYVSGLLDSIGWPQNLSKEANLGIFFVIYHADIEFMRKYYLLVRQQVENKTLSMQLFTSLHDKIKMKAGKPQTFGTHIIRLNNKVYIWPVEDPANVEFRRNKMKLIPMEVYLKMIKAGQSPQEVIWDQNLTVDDIVTAQRSQ